NVIERASLLLKGDVIRPANLLLQSDHELTGGGTHRPVLDPQGIVPLHEVKKQQVLSALKACSGNKSLTAKALGISLSTLKRTLAEINLGNH
ncbi:MAG: hypothetical protein KKE57_08245, partial [Proteobacteria bacterium]|nr:hypothetical protein [Pseudomonadota bacterium]